MGFSFRGEGERPSLAGNWGSPSGMPCPEGMALQRAQVRARDVSVHVREDKGQSSCVPQVWLRAWLTCAGRASRLGGRGACFREAATTRTPRPAPWSRIRRIDLGTARRGAGQSTRQVTTATPAGLDFTVTEATDEGGADEKSAGSRDSLRRGSAAGKGQGCTPRGCSPNRRALGWFGCGNGRGQPGRCPKARPATCCGWPSPRPQPVVRMVAQPAQPAQATDCARADLQ